MFIVKIILEINFLWIYWITAVNFCHLQEAIPAFLSPFFRSRRSRDEQDESRGQGNKVSERYLPTTGRSTTSPPLTIQSYKVLNTGWTKAQNLCNLQAVSMQIIHWVRSIWSEYVTYGIIYSHKYCLDPECAYVLGLLLLLNPVFDSNNAWISRMRRRQHRSL